MYFAIVSLNLPKLLIDLFQLKFPSHYYGLTPSHFLTLPAFYLLFRLFDENYRRNTLLIIAQPLAIFLTCLFLLDLINFNGFSTFAVTIEILLFFSFFWLSAECFRNRIINDKFFTHLVMLYCCVLLFLLFLWTLHLGSLSLNILNYSEVIGRNSLAFVGCVLIWISLFCQHSLIQLTNRTLLVLIGVTLLYSIAGSSRFCVIILCVALILKFVSITIKSKRLLPYTATLIVLFSLVISLFPSETSGLLLQIAFIVKTSYSDIISSNSKIYTNIMLLYRLEDSFATGIGWSEASNVNYAGFLGHNLIVNFLLTYGSAGLVVLLVYSRYITKFLNIFSVDGLIILAILSLNLIYINDMPLIFSLLLGCYVRVVQEREANKVNDQ